MSKKPADENPSTHPLTLALANIVRTCLEEKHFALPLHMACIAVNGAVLVGRYTANDTGSTSRPSASPTSGSCFR